MIYSAGWSGERCILKFARAGGRNEFFSETVANVYHWQNDHWESEWRQEYWILEQRIGTFLEKIIHLRTYDSGSHFVFVAESRKHLGLKSKLKSIKVVIKTIWSTCLSASKYKLFFKENFLMDKEVVLESRSAVEKLKIPLDQNLVVFKLIVHESKIILKIIQS